MCSITPIAHMVSDLVAPFASCQTLIPKGASPETFDPTPTQILNFSQTKLFFSAGLPFEASWIPRLQKNFPTLTTIDLSLGLSKTGEDPHLWVSPKALIKMLTVAKKELAVHFPQHLALIEKNATRTLHKLHTDDALLQKSIISSSHKTFISIHPAWAQLAKDYGLQEISIEEEGKEPSPKQLHALSEKVLHLGLTKLLIPLEFKTSSSETLAKSMHLTPTYVDIMSENYSNFGQAFSLILQSGF